MKKFTFKTDKSTGRFKSFFSSTHNIKFNSKQIGSIQDEIPFTISLMVIKDDIKEDGNLNCIWKWIKLKKESTTLQEAKDFLNNNLEEIFKRYKIHIE